ncbi:hypothetical protein M1563_00790 [Patescibacteria group bacterium]|nr:hypothetical protein [Patescibacteria group bacterium]MCL5410152.1 hypothetical protein [Patescibacteria group bacterium]
MLKIIRIILTVILLLPTIFFLIFMLGEVFSGDWSGFSHLIQAAPFIVLIYLIWKFPILKKKH